MNLFSSRLSICLAALALATPLALANEQSEQDTYVFAWPFVEGEMLPRGGTTKGPPVETLTETTNAFERLQADGLSKLERDRRAILAMAGTYRVSFDFLELVGYAPGFEPARPYRSWATEHVYVSEDMGERISLQHVLIMTIVTDDGEEMGPFVTKHWRQDWVFENPAVHTYRGFGTWARTTKGETERAGYWSQSVWQVDDSPRYAAWGEWRHTPERSWWTSDETWRPLPRREFAVREDYDALIGTNTHVVLPTGWVQEEHNVKAVLSGPGEIKSRLAREIGIVRYERLKNFETRPGDSYWQNTGAFWREVRDYWQRSMSDATRIRLKSEVDGEKLFQPLFERASAINDGEAFTEEENRTFVVQTIDSFRAAPEEEASTEY